MQPRNEAWLVSGAMGQDWIVPGGLLGSDASLHAGLPLEDH